MDRGGRTSHPLSAARVSSGTDLVVFLEDVRAPVGPLHVNAGYQSIEVNRAVGREPTSSTARARQRI
jgi:hypothetical protein